MTQALHPNSPPRSPGKAWRALLLFVAMIALVGGASGLGSLLNANRLLGAVIGSGVGAAVACLAAGFFMLRAAARGDIVDCSGPTPASQRLGGMISLWMGAYVAAVVLISWVVEIEDWPLWARAGAALLPALPIGGVIHALIRHLDSEPDEYQRLLTTRAVLIGAGATFFLVTAWGYLEKYADAGPFPTLLVMVPFWLIYGFASLWLRWRNR